MLGAVQRIEGYVAGATFDQLATDSRTLAAINYELLVLGEAASRIPDEFASAHPELPWRELRGMRNVLVHGYFQISPPIVWDTVQRDLPALRPLLERLLGTLP